jgi:hypothetical protein
MACSESESKNTVKKHLQFNNIQSVIIVHDLLVTKFGFMLNSDQIATKAQFKAIKIGLPDHFCCYLVAF